MKIYVSEKENINLNRNVYLTFELNDETKESVDWKVTSKSLEQHEAEIRKPLEDEIVKLNEFISRLISEKEPETAREITERHHREIMLERKNRFLEEEIERLKKQLDLNDKEHFNNALKQLRETDYESVKKPLEEEIERLKNRIEILYNAQTITTKNYEEQIPVFEQQERLKVIAELEEWASKELSVYTPRQTDYETPDQILFSHRKVFTDDLKQKLKEMKEVRDE